ncbi:MAG: hypothetical protein LBG87_09130 [Spirochaetaceae bacterium]|jgi:hypothetical protein|nr:hypothetical protein [Spirochaetaceae bacterium]
MRDILWLRAVCLGAFLVAGAIAPGCSQNAQARYITPDILRNWVLNQQSLSDALTDLSETHPDPAVQARTGEYMEEVENAVYRLGYILEGILTDMPAEDNLAQVYRKALRIRVPAEVKAAYEENGLGKQGHQVFMCLLFGFFCVEAKRSFDEPPPPKAQKLLTILESLIHPQDLTLIEQFADEIF